MLRSFNVAKEYLGRVTLGKAASLSNRGALTPHFIQILGCRAPTTVEPERHAMIKPDRGNRTIRHCHSVQHNQRRGMPVRLKHGCQKPPGTLICLL